MSGGSRHRLGLAGQSWRHWAGVAHGGLGVEVWAG